MHLWNCQVASLIWQPLAQGLASLLRSFTCGSSSQFFPLWRLLLWACGIVTVLHLWRSSMKPFTCCHRHCHRHCSDIAIVFLLSSCRCHNLIFTLLNPEWLTWWSRSSGSGVLGLRCFAGVSVVEEVEKKNAKLNKRKKSKKKKAHIPVETVRQQYRSSNHLHRAVIFHSTFQHEHMCHRVTEAEGGWC